MQVPETIIGTAAGLALLPALSQMVSRGDYENLRRTISSSLRGVSALTMPAGIMLLFLVRPFVQVLFEGSAFGPNATELVVFAAQMFLLGLVGHSLLEVSVRAFYAHRDAITPTVVAVLAMGLQIVISLNLVRVPRLGYAGLALSNSLAFTLQSLVLLVILCVRLRAFNAAFVLRGLGKITCASGVMAIALAVFVGCWHPASELEQGLFGLLLAVGTYAVASLALRLEEVQQLRALVLGRLPSR